MFCENRLALLLSVVELPAGGEVAVTPDETVIRAVASAVPVSFLATRWYVVDSLGVTLVAPLGSTLPMPSMLISLAKSVDHDRRAAWLGAMVLGVAVNVALGAGADVGGIGVGGVGFFLLHAATASRSTTAETTLSH